jgi:alpha-tubulin suppressor-like RCC1 family protein
VRIWGFVWVLVAVSACYRGASELPSCTIRCTDGCPNGTTCSSGFCTTGASCAGSAGSDAGIDAGIDAAPCGGIGEACCASGPSCTGNGYCATGTCQGDCVTDVAFARRHSCMIRHDGTVWCSGDNTYGQLGTNMTGPAVAAFVQASDAAGVISDATGIGAGSYHTCVVRTGGTVWCWGANSQGQLGDNTVTASPVAVQVVKSGPTPLTGIVEITGGDRDTCARDNAGAVWCWGLNDAGQLGDGTMTTRGYAVQVPGIAAATGVSLGLDEACAVDGAAHVSCWGAGYYGQLGDGTGTTRLSPVPVVDATAVAAGGWVGCALLATGAVDCWGRGMQGRTGNGNESSALSPQPVLVGPMGAPLGGIASIAVGAVSCAVTTDHRVLCWGVSPHGQVGNGAGSMFPVEIATGGSGADRVFAHYAHACAHTLDGNLWCWGRNTEGELGNGTFANAGMPQPIASICR